jgi:glutathione S-transferase
MKAGDQRQPEYLTVNPMGKVPAIRHGDAVVTEQVAVYLYLADLFPEAGLAPPIGDPLRGPYLRWFAFYGSAFEPAITDRALKREPPPPGMSGYGDYDTMFNALTGQLKQGPYMLGERFTALDLLWGGALSWMLMFKLLPELPEIVAYTQRHMARPSFAKVRGIDTELMAKHAASAA